jgi:hypothetical protein
LNPLVRSGCGDGNNLMFDGIRVVSGKYDIWEEYRSD